MASNITVDTLTKGSTTLNTDEIVDTNSNQICKAWVNFNGTGTVAIRDSYNVSSVTDNSTGDYTTNFTTSLSANYVASMIAGRASSNPDVFSGIVTLSTSSIRTRSVNSGNNVVDVEFAQLSFFGD